MPAKTTKKAAKGAKGEAGKKRKRAHRHDGFETYTFKVLKQTHPDTGISQKGMAVMNSMTQEALNRIVAQAAQLADANHKKTISTREIQTAVRLLLPGELAKHAVSEGTKAVTKYNAD